MITAVLDVVIVSWNTCDLLRACLTHIVQDPCVRRIVVVDNGSHDGSAAMVRAEFPDVICFAETVNHGFAGGNNIGLRYLLAHDPAALIGCLNPDTVVHAGALAHLSAYMLAHTDVVVCGPQLRYGDGSWQSSLRRFPTPMTYLCESTPFAQRWPRNPWVRAFQMHDADTNQDCRVDWLVGAVLVVRTAAIQLHGVFDEQFALYSEEVEWQRRLCAGKRGAVVYCADAVVTHYEGQSSQQIPTQRRIWFFQSRLRDAWLAYGRSVAEGVRWGLLVQFGMEWLSAAAKWVLGHRRALRLNQMQATAALLAGIWEWHPTAAVIW